MTPEAHITDHLTFLYGPEQAGVALEQLLAILDDFRLRNPRLQEQVTGERLTEQDVILITYGDQVAERANHRCKLWPRCWRPTSEEPSPASTSCPSSPIPPTTAFPSLTTPLSVPPSARGRDVLRGSSAVCDPFVAARRGRGVVRLEFDPPDAELLGRGRIVDLFRGLFPVLDVAGNVRAVCRGGSVGFVGLRAILGNPPNSLADVGRWGGGGGLPHSLRRGVVCGGRVALARAAA